MPDDDNFDHDGYFLSNNSTILEKSFYLFYKRVLFYQKTRKKLELFTFELEKVNF